MAATDNVHSGNDGGEAQVTCDHHRNANAESWAMLDAIHAEIDPKIERMKKLIYTKEELDVTS
mgnify:CR=1 FL=1|tara:strand:- start:196 stop:384 length:189 start_codon:yes stop_codon:yes gene_type:complete